MKCPDCKCQLDDTNEVRPSESWENYDVRVLKCHKCGAEYDEEEIANDE